MPKRAISITLEADNLTWLKGRAGAKNDTVSALIDQMVSAARQSAPGAESRSVVGTIDIDSSDPLLEKADAAVRAAFDLSLGRPIAVHEARPPYEAAPAKARRRRG